MINNDLAFAWELGTVTEIVAPERSACVTGPFGSSIGKKFWVDAGVPVIRGNNLTVNGEKFIDDDFVFVSDDYANQLNRYSAFADDIVFTAAGTLGQVGIIPRKAKYARYIISNKQMRLRVDKTKTDPLFAFYWFRSPMMVDVVIRQNTGSSVPLINLGILRSLPFPRVPLPIQHRIANILGALDDKIECNRRINQTLEAMAQTRYKHWFVDFASGEMPEGWREGKLGDIADNVRVAADPRNVPSETPYIGLEHMPRGSIALSEWGTAKDVTSNKSEFQRKQILFGKLRPYFKKVGVAPTDGVCSSDILVIQPRSRNSYGLVLCQLIQDEFISFTEMSSGGTKMPRISWEQMAQYPIPIPPDNVMNQFNSQIESWVEIIISNVIENQTLTRTRDYLLPKLLSGEVALGHGDAVPQPSDESASR